MQLLSDLLSQYSKWRPLEGYVSRIGLYRDNDRVQVLENCKALVESICKTILKDLRCEIKTHIELKGLVAKTCNEMGCMKNSADLVRSFASVAHSLGEFRNVHSAIGHGQPVDQLEESKKIITIASTQFMIATIEQLAVFLITVYQVEYPQHIQRQMRYEDNRTFNEQYDENNDVVEIGGYGPYSPSETLYYIDREAYRSELINYKQTPKAQERND